MSLSPRMPVYLACVILSLTQLLMVHPFTVTPDGANEPSTEETPVLVERVGIPNQIKPLATIVAVAIFAAIGFLVAKLLDRWYDRKEPPENASDCSETTRDLLKARLAVFSLNDYDVHSNVNKARRLGNLWRFKTVFNDNKKIGTSGVMPQDVTDAAGTEEQQKHAKIYVLSKRSNVDGKDGMAQKDRFIDMPIKLIGIPQLPCPENDVPDMPYVQTGNTSSEGTATREGFTLELTLGPSRLGHYADSDFGSNTSLTPPPQVTCHAMI